MNVQTWKKKRQIKLTAKALGNKIEWLQHERKSAVNKVKALIPQIKAHKKSKENANEIPSQLNKLNALCKNITDLHNELKPLLPDDEDKKQNEWFFSIMDYSDAFKEQVEKWIKEYPHENSNKSPLQTNTSEQPKEMNHVEQVPDEKICLLLTLQYLFPLKILRMNYSPVTVSQMQPRDHVGSKSRSKVSDGVNSYCEKTCSKQQLNVNATEFVPSMPVKPKPNAMETTQTAVKPKVIHLPDEEHLPGPSYMLQRYLMAPKDPVTNVTQTDS